MALSPQAVDPGDKLIYEDQLGFERFLNVLEVGHECVVVMGYGKNRRLTYNELNEVQAKPEPR